MNYNELLVDLREKVGRPGIDDVNDRRLLTFLTSAIDFMAAELQWPIKTNTAGIGFSADQYEYPLSDDSLDGEIAEILWVRYNGKLLEPASIAQWVRDGVDWRDATSGSPDQWAFEGLTLYVYPPPSSSVVSDDAAPEIGYIEASPSLDTSATNATTYLTPAAHGCLVWKAAEEYFTATIDKDNLGQRNLQIQAAAKQVADRLNNLKRMVKHGARSSGPKPSVFSRHGGAAR